MRPKKMTPAHHSGNFAELVCSNSLRADGTGNAVGVLKAEMEMMDSLIIKYARKHQVPAGGALAVDRNNFSQAITEYIHSHPLIEVIHEEAKEFPAGYTIIASGPLTSDALATAIKEKLGEDYFYFFDAAAPIIAALSPQSLRSGKITFGRSFSGNFSISALIRSRKPWLAATPPPIIKVLGLYSLIARIVL